MWCLVLFECGQQGLLVVVDCDCGGVKECSATCYDVAVSRENLLTIRSWTLSFVLLMEDLLTIRSWTLSFLLLMEVCFIATPESFESE